MKQIALWTAMLLAGVALAGDQPGPTLSGDEQKIIELTNEQRKEAGLGTLKPCEMLLKAAREHSANMARQRKMAHELDGKWAPDRVKKIGYAYFMVGENVAWNQKTPQEVVDGWMKSRHHRDNILNKEFTEIGVGIVANEEGEPYYTQVFGRPQTSDEASSVRFKIRNESENAVNVTLPGSDKTYSLEAGSTGTYTVSGVAPFPPTKLKAGKKLFELICEKGRQYVVSQTAEGISVYAERP
ncbi:MAG TPA: CAP domain-containing protein [Planctomycetota bacterium]|jgi:hypothetical protein